MQNVPIQALPNQEFTITLDNNLYDIAIRATNGVMCMTVTRNSVLIIENVRCVAGYPVIPYRYLEDGNFMFITSGGTDLPAYDQFGITQQLIYFSQNEIDAFRAPPTPPLTAAFFNPLGDLPLRFKPQGYTLAT